MGLKELIFKAGLTQAKFAARVGVAPTSVHSWINGNMQPRPYNIAKMAAILGVPSNIIRQSIICIRYPTNAKKLQKLRRASGMSQKELGERIGVVASGIGSWEVGKFLPPKKYRPALERVFGKASNIEYATK